MRKEEYGLAAVAFLLLSLHFPPYFVSFLAASAIGGLGYLLKTLNEKERDDLVKFEIEFRKGYQLELRGEKESAKALYLLLAERYPRFRYIVEERVQWLTTRQSDSLKQNILNKEKETKSRDSYELSHL